MSNTQQAINREAKVIQHLLKDDGVFPNSIHPVLVYKSVLRLNDGSHPKTAEDIFESNNWKNTWRNGILNSHHYHSITHEVLGVYSGKCHIMLGGDEGIEFEINNGDVIILPAGVAHKNVGCTEDFKCVGAYPNGADYDMNYGKAGERPGTDHNIAQVEIPELDPVFGKDGPLPELWRMPIA